MSWVGQCLLDPFQGDFIEGDAFVIFKAQHLLDMPTDAFAFTVRIGCQIDVTGFFGRRFHCLHGASALLQNLVYRREVFAHTGGNHVGVLAFGREVADMAATGNHLPVFAGA